MKERLRRLDFLTVLFVFFILDSCRSLYLHAHEGVVFEFRSAGAVGISLAIGGVSLALILLMRRAWGSIWPDWVIPALAGLIVFGALVEGTVADSVGIVWYVALLYASRPRPPRQRKRRIAWGKAAQTQAAVDRLYR